MKDMPPSSNFGAMLSEKASQEEFQKAVAAAFHRQIFGRMTDSYNVDALAFFAAGISSSQYAIRHMSKAHRVAAAPELLRFAVSAVTVNGLFLEFGVFSGTTINQIAALCPREIIYGFDSFEGLPEPWRPGFPKGAFATSERPRVRRNVELIAGWFDRTLPTFLYDHKDEPVALMHIDCDIYSSTQIVFAQLRGRIVPGTIIVFDEYFNYPGWELHEFRAFQEYLIGGERHYEYIGLVPGHQQVAVRITG